jgi:hypothetical protein
MPLAAGLVLGVVVAALNSHLDVRSASASRHGLILAVSWWLVPPTVLYLAAQLPFVSVLTPGYARSALPGMALALGWLIGRLDPDTARRIVVTIVVIVSMLLSGGRWHGSEDWRGAALAVNRLASPATPVLVHTAYTQSRYLQLFDDPEQRSFLLSPLSRYPFEGRIILMPYLLSEQTERYLQALSERVLTDARRFILVTRYPIVPYREWLDGRLKPHGFSSRVIGFFGQVEVVFFEHRLN